jgi:hypothetical protein
VTVSAFGLNFLTKHDHNIMPRQARDKDTGDIRAETVLHSGCTTPFMARLRKTRACLTQTSVL